MSKEFKMSRAEVEILQEKLAKYLSEEKVETYRPETVLDDVIYFLGASIDSEEYQFAQGYRKFSEFLINHFKANHPRDNSYE